MGKGSHNDDAQSSCLSPYALRGFMRRSALRKKHFRNGLGVSRIGRLATEELSDRAVRRRRNRIPSQVFEPIDHYREAGVKSDLQKVRALAETRLRSGNVPDWSWPQHVQLIEAVDAMLHDISVSETAPRAKRYTGAPLRLVTVSPAEPDTRRKTGSMR